MVIEGKNMRTNQKLKHTRPNEQIKKNAMHRTLLSRHTKGLAIEQIERRTILENQTKKNANRNKIVLLVAHLE